jgi:hypothetical protein
VKDNDFVCEISASEAIRFLRPRHYSGRTPSISKAFGWYRGTELIACCTFGKPPSPAPCKGLCGETWADNVYELNRLCRVDNLDEPLSKFVAFCLKKLKPLNWIIISYSDMAMNHHGYIYQACNFIYTGVTKERTDMVFTHQKHPGHYTQDEIVEGVRRIRSAKHRYVYFCTNHKNLKKKWMKCLNYPPQPYPKGDNNPDYKLGDFLKEKIVKKGLF